MKLSAPFVGAASSAVTGAAFGSDFGRSVNDSAEERGKDGAHLGSSGKEAACSRARVITPET